MKSLRAGKPLEPKMVLYDLPFETTVEMIKAKLFESTGIVM